MLAIEIGKKSASCILCMFIYSPKGLHSCCEIIDKYILSSIISKSFIDQLPLLMYN